MNINDRTRNITSWVGCGFIGFLFISAALAKWDYSFQLEKDVMRFFGSAEGFPQTIHQFIPRFLIALELTLGIALFQPHWRKRLLLPLTMLILVGFTGYLLTLNPNQENCGCFGAWMKMGPRASIAKNLVMLAICALSWHWSKSDPRGKLSIYILTALLAAACVVVFVALPMRTPPPPDQPQFADLDNFENAGGRELNQGVVLLAFLNATCEHCEAFAEYLADCEYPLFLAINDEGEGLQRVEDFRMMTDIDQFPWMLTNDDLFYPHIAKAPPRIYIVVDGKAVKHWEGKIDMELVKKTYIEIARKYEGRSQDMQ